MRNRIVVSTVLATLLINWSAAYSNPVVENESATVHRLYEGLTAFIDSDGREPLTIDLWVRDLNLMEPGPREILVKLYDPNGQTIVREVIPDDGIAPLNQVPMAGWDHEAWYYAYLRQKGALPMIPWSAPSVPQRLAQTPARHFRYIAPESIKGRYRMVLVGAIDHYVSIQTSPDQPCAFAGNPQWLHGHGDMFRKSYFYVPAGSTGLHLAAVQHDAPADRTFTVSDADGRILMQTAPLGFVRTNLLFESGQYDHQVLKLEVSPGKHDFLIDLTLQYPRDPAMQIRPRFLGIAAALAHDEQTARKLQGGAIYHDQEVFWNHNQVRLHAYLKNLPAEAFEVRDDQGNPIEPDKRTGQYHGLPVREGFLKINDKYWGAPPCDLLMYHYLAHRRSETVILAARDLARGLRAIGPNDHAAAAPFRNLGYEFSNYAFPYWRPAWRIIRQSDAPAELKEILREAIIDAGDRLAFCRGLARINGNSFGLTMGALRYAVAATDDPMQSELFETNWERFTSGGFGERVGVGPSGGIQESFGYDHHYGAYTLNTWPAILADLQDPRFQEVYDNLRTLYSYTQSEQLTGAWSARTSGQPQWPIEQDGPFAWKGLPGPGFTVSVNDGNEWFAARREGYYALTYHGRLGPKWVGYGFGGQIGYGGGMLSQVHIPGRGIVLASSLNGAYGKDMHSSNWRNFSLHSLVGTLADGRPVVSADSEHFNARLDGVAVTGSGPLREASVAITRSYRFEDDAILCSLALEAADTEPMFDMWVPNTDRKTLVEAYEMIPYYSPPKQRAQSPATMIHGIDDQGVARELSDEPVVVQSVKIDRAGYGVVIELETARPVLLGANNTLLIQLIDRPSIAGDIVMSYRIVPFGAK